MRTESTSASPALGRALALIGEGRHGEAEKVLRSALVADVGNRTVRHYRSLSDTANLSAALDLVILVDTSIAHLTDALGKPCRILLPRHSDWRWLPERRDCPWYPAALLFRLSHRGAWDEVVSEVMERLSVWASRCA